MDGSVCTLEGFGVELGRIVKRHVEEQKRIADELVQKAGRKCAQELRDGPNTPRSNLARSGAYAAGWASKSQRDRDDFFVSTAYNRTNWQLTHLLENGHVLFYMGIPMHKRTRAFPHIEPAFHVGAEVIEGATVDN